VVSISFRKNLSFRKPKGEGSLLRDGRDQLFPRRFYIENRREGRAGDSTGHTEQGKTNGRKNGRHLGNKDKKFLRNSKKKEVCRFVNWGGGCPGEGKRGLVFSGDLRERSHFIRPREMKVKITKEEAGPRRLSVISQRE